MNNICPICKGKDVSLYTITRDYQYSQNISEYKAYKCNFCQCIFQYPFPKNEDFNYIYPENYYAHTENSKTPFLTRFLREKIQKGTKSEFVKKKLFPYLEELQKCQNILDIGCGKGLFLDVMKDSGKITHGFEPDANACNILRSKGHIVYNALAEVGDDTLDIITSFQSFEHIGNPEELVNEIYRILKIGGYFIAETPNAVCSLAKLKDKWRALELPRHLILHSPKTIRNLFDEEKFDLKIYIRVSPTDVKSSFFLKWNIKNTFFRFLFKFYLIPKIIFSALFTNDKGSLLIWKAKKY